MRTAIFFQSLVFLLGRVRHIAGSQGNAYEKQGSHFYKTCWQLHQPSCTFELFLSHCEEVWWSRWSCYERWVWGTRAAKIFCVQTGEDNAMVKGRPSSVIPHGLRGQSVRCTAKPPFVLLQWFLQLKSSSGLGEALHCHRGWWLM